MDLFRERSRMEVSLKFFDSDCPKSEQLPRKFQIIMTEKIAGVKFIRGQVQSYYQDQLFGHPLTDNNDTNDGYRYHDVFHLSYLAVLGWSPVMRQFFNCPRQNNFEDGPEAQKIEEIISAFIFGADNPENYSSKQIIPDFILSQVRAWSEPFETKIYSEFDWEKAILAGYGVWEKLKKHRQGIIEGNLYHRSLKFFPFC